MGKFSFREMLFAFSMGSRELANWGTWVGALWGMLKTFFFLLLASLTRPLPIVYPELEKNSKGRFGSIYERSAEDN